MTQMIKATTVYDYPTYKRYALFHLSKGRLYLTIIPCVISFLAIIIACVSLILFGYNRTLVVCLTVLILYLFLQAYLYFFSPKAHYKSNRGLANLRNDFEFGESGITVRSVNANTDGTSTWNYDVLYKAYETKDSFYLYVNRLQAFIVSKDGFTEGSATELSVLLSGKLPPKKYILR
jgi:hypothetical protein